MYDSPRGKFLTPRTNLKMTADTLAVLGPPPLTIPEIAEYLRMHTTTVYELVKPGPNGEAPKLKSYRVGAGGGAIRVKVADFQAFLEASGSDGASAVVEPEPVKRTRAIPKRMGERGGKKKVG